MSLLDQIQAHLAFLEGIFSFWVKVPAEPGPITDMTWLSSTEGSRIFGPQMLEEIGHEPEDTWAALGL